MTLSVIILLPYGRYSTDFRHHFFSSVPCRSAYLAQHSRPKPLSIAVELFLPPTQNPHPNRSLWRDQSLLPVSEITHVMRADESHRTLDRSERWAKWLALRESAITTTVTRASVMIVSAYLVSYLWAAVHTDCIRRTHAHQSRDMFCSTPSMRTQPNWTPFFVATIMQIRLFGWGRFIESKKNRWKMKHKLRKLSSGKAPDLVGWVFSLVAGCSNAHQWTVTSIPTVALVSESIAFNWSRFASINFRTFLVRSAANTTLVGCIFNHTRDEKNENAPEFRVWLCIWLRTVN